MLHVHYYRDAIRMHRTIIVHGDVNVSVAGNNILAAVEVCSFICFKFPAVGTIIISTNLHN
jgi:hypothetical protein